MDQFSHWFEEYMCLDRAGKTRMDGAPGEYSIEAYKLFPRYRLDDAIRIEIERLTGQEFQSVDEARQSLLDAGRCAMPELVRQFQRRPDAVATLNDELKSFEDYISALESEGLGRIDSLPYRRVLQESESKLLWDKLDTAWGTDSRYYPLSDCDPAINVIAFHTELWDARGGATVLRDVLRENGVERCIVLREGPPHYKVDLSLVDPIYDGLETFVTSDDFTWLVYVSHESSIAVSGWLADFFRSKWPDWVKLTYGGPFHTSDLRGSWGDLKR